MEKSQSESTMSCDPADPRRSRVPGPESGKYATEDSTGVGAQAPGAVNATGCSKKLVQQAFHRGLFITRPRSGSVGQEPLSTSGDKADDSETAPQIFREEKESPSITEEQNVNPFSRGGAVQRSPPTRPVIRDECTIQSETALQDKQPTHGTSRLVQLHGTRERSNSLGSAENALIRKSQAAKRVRVEDDEKDDRQSEVMSVIARLTKVTAGLVKIVSGDENIREEIKIGIQDLRNQIDQLNKTTSVWEWETMPHTSKTRAVMKSTAECGTQTEKCISNRSRNISTQTERKGPEAGMYTSKEEDLDLKEKIHKCNDTKGLVEIIDQRWPEEAYRAVKIEKGNPFSMDKDWDVVVIAKPEQVGTDKPKGIRNMLKRAYPDTLELLNNSTPGTIEYTVLTSKSSKKEIVDKERWIYVVPYSETSEGQNQVQMLCHQIQNLKKMVEESGRKGKIAIAADEGVNKDHLRKILEIFLAKYTPEIKLLVQGSDTQKVDTEKHKGSKRVETIIVKGEGSYADTLKKMKSKVSAADMKELGVTVRSVRKDKEGKVIMKVMGDADALKDKFISVLDSAAVGVGREEIFHVTGLDEDVTADEIKIAIETELGVPVHVKSIRPTQYGSKTATITMSTKSARNLSSVTSVGIGWTRCRLRKRVFVEKCYRCWETGHRARDCKGPDRATLCRRCGADNHKAESCKSAPFCPLCETPGHRAATTGCPKFRSAIYSADHPRYRGRTRTAQNASFNGY